MAIAEADFARSASLMTRFASFAARSAAATASWLARRLDRTFAFAPAADGRFGNVVLARGPLEESLVEACNRVGATLRGPMPAYNR